MCLNYPYSFPYKYCLFFLSFHFSILHYFLLFSLLYLLLRVQKLSNFEFDQPSASIMKIFASFLVSALLPLTAYAQGTFLSLPPTTI